MKTALQVCAALGWLMVSIHFCDALPTAVLTQHNDAARTGDNLVETDLNVTNVNTNTFGLLYTRPVDDQIYAQPLVMTNVSIPGVGLRNVVYVCTVNNSVYAYDADSMGVTAPYWMVNFNNPPNIVPPRNTDMTGACGGDYPNYSGNIGIASTPVIDPVAGTIYVVARTLEFKTNFVQRLHALDITTGAERTNSPVVISATCPGSGSGSVNDVIAFDPWRENQRAALALVNNVIYIAWASHCDWTPYHGWVIGYNATTLSQTAVYNDTPNGDQGGIWMSGQGVASDPSGNLYLATGNGTVDTSGTIDRSMSFLKLTPSGSNLVVSSWFTPHDWSSLDSGDLDLGSGGVLLIPGTNLLIGGGKGGKLYLVNRDNMGGLSPTNADTNILQSFQVTTTSFSDNEIHGAPVWWDGPNGSYLYVWGESDYLRQYEFDPTNGLFVLPQLAQSPTHAPWQGAPGGIASISANGTNSGTGIVWASVQLSGDADPNVRPGILHAYDAENVSVELWNSEQLGVRDSVGKFAKYVPPTIANGKVYLATFSGSLNVYGLLPQPLNAGPPLIFQQPQPASATRYVGASLTYQAPAGGFLPLVYQWFQNATAIPGATNSSYTMSSLTLAGSGNYGCTISNQYGFTNSSTVALNVIPAPTSNYPAAVLADHPIAYWCLDETNGVVANDFVGGHDGVFTNVALGLPDFDSLAPDTAVGVGQVYNTTWTTNSCVGQINGIDFYDQGSNAEFSVEAWVKQNAASKDNGIVALGFGGGGEQFCLSAPNGTFKFFVRNAVFDVYAVTSSLGNDTNWHHVAGTVDEAGGTMSLYVDGVWIGSTAIPPGASIAAATTPISIGARESGWVTGNNLQLSASVSDVAIYNYPLSAAQVAAHYNGQQNVPPGVPIVLDPTGTNYTGVSASSVYGSGYVASNLFNKNVSGIPLGTQLDTGGTGVDWAEKGTSPAYVAFQLDQVYTVQAIFYAQRVGGNPSLDKITQMNLWASQTTPFNPLAPPTNAPGASLPITETGSAIWFQYLMSAPITGRYFLAEVEQNPTTGGNIGGNELRLGMIVPSVSIQASLTSSGLVLNWPSPGLLLQADQITGPWTPATGIVPGMPFAVSGPARFYRVRY